MALPLLPWLAFDPVVLRLVLLRPMSPRLVLLCPVVFEALVALDLVLVGNIAQANMGRSDGDLVLGLVFSFLLGKACASLAIVYIDLVGTLAIALNPVLPQMCIRLIPLDYIALLLFRIGDGVADVVVYEDEEMTLPVPSVLLAMCSYATWPRRLLRVTPNMCVVKVVGYLCLWANALSLLRNLLIFLSPNVELKHMGNSLCMVTTDCNSLMDSVLRLRQLPTVLLLRAVTLLVSVLNGIVSFLADRLTVGSGHTVLSRCPCNRVRTVLWLNLVVLYPPMKTNAGILHSVSRCYSALARFRMLLALEIIRTVQLSICSICLALVVKLMRFGALSRASCRLLRLINVRRVKTATFCVPLKEPALRNVLLRLICFNPWTLLAWQSSVLDSAAPFVLIRVMTFVITRPTSRVFPLTCCVTVGCSINTLEKNWEGTTPLLDWDVGITSY